jgi:uncharacterized membrane protein
METRGLALVVMTFDDENEARDVVTALRNLEHVGRLSIDDTAVIRRDADGKIHVDNEADSAVKGGAVIGGFLGLLIGSILFPLGGLVLGAAGGALVGKLMDTGIDKTFVKEVSESLQPGGSALFVTSRGGDPAAVVGALKPFKGTLYHTNLSSEAEQSLRDALAG